MAVGSRNKLRFNVRCGPTSGTLKERRDFVWLSRIENPFLSIIVPPTARAIMRQLSRRRLRVLTSERYRDFFNSYDTASQSSLESSTRTASSAYASKSSDT